MRIEIFKRSLALTKIMKGKWRINKEEKGTKDNSFQAAIWYIPDLCESYNWHTSFNWIGTISSDDYLLSLEMENEYKCSATGFPVSSFGNCCQGILLFLHINRIEIALKCTLTTKRFSVYIVIYIFWSHCQTSVKKCRYWNSLHVPPCLITNTDKIEN